VVRRDWAKNLNGWEKMGEESSAIQQRKCWDIKHEIAQILAALRGRNEVVGACKKAEQS